MCELTNAQIQQRDELHRKIWSIAKDLRGAVDGWDFKQYILGTIFYRFVSENIVQYFNETEWEAGNKTFDYAGLDDETALAYFKENTVNEKGFFILPSDLFQNLAKNPHQNKNLNIDFAKALKAIEESALGSPSENDIKGLFDEIDTTSSRLGRTVAQKNKRLADILVGIADLNFGRFEDNAIDLFGDAYEFLISKYASEAGKSGGEFFTPQSVSKLLSYIVMAGRDHVNKVYDPTCGSGSLLLQMKKNFGDGAVKNGYYGQEINLTNFNLARMNMFLHNISYNDFSIRRGDTLLELMHEDETPFDAIVSNPPYSLDWVGKKDPTLINDPRFAPAGVLAPPSKADHAFNMHILYNLSSKGRAAIVSFPGSLYRKGAEAKIREYMVEQGFVEAVIQLPDNLFFGTSISTCILVLSKNKQDNDVLFVNAVDEYTAVTKNNVMEQQHIDRIVKALEQRQDEDGFARLVSAEEIEKNQYNLSVSTYVDSVNTREEIDIVVLNQEIEATVSRIDALRASIHDIVIGLSDDVEDMEDVLGGGDDE